MVSCNQFARNPTKEGKQKTGLLGVVCVFGAIIQRKGSVFMEINKKIKELRKLNNLTQIELAKRTGITRSTIAQYESREVEPTATNIIKLSVIFDVSADYLLGLEYEDGTRISKKDALAKIGVKH